MGCPKRCCGQGRSYIVQRKAGKRCPLARVPQQSVRTSSMPSSNGSSLARTVLLSSSLPSSTSACSPCSPTCKPPGLADSGVTAADLVTGCQSLQRGHCRCRQGSLQERRCSSHGRNRSHLTAAWEPLVTSAKLHCAASRTALMRCQELAEGQVPIVAPLRRTTSPSCNKSAPKRSSCARSSCSSSACSGPALCRQACPAAAQHSGGEVSGAQLLPSPF